MIAEALAIGGLGFLSALGLGVAAKVFYVEVDPLVEAIEENLPGANCGGCGLAGCSSAAEAIASGKMSPSGCVGGGPEVAAAISAIMGVEMVETEPDVAQVGCRYPVERADLKYHYSGLQDCRAAKLLAGGSKQCPIGCLGLGSCVQACPFGALEMGPDGLPRVDPYKCTGCGTCVRVCPQGIMKLTSVSRRILGEYQTDDCTAPCQRTCPAGINIPEQLYQTAQGNYDQALRVIKERNPLPLICGRICPRPCEAQCRRNLADEPVAINYMKRFVADRERESGQRQQAYRAPATGKKAAVIGGGVQGLSAAYFLARLGHSPTIYEAMDQLGGILRTAIPPSRLPREVLDWEIQGILEMGVEAQTGVSFGRDFSLSSLFAQGHQAVLLATGGWDSLLMRGPLPEPAPALPGLYLALPLSMAWAAGREIKPGDKVAVVGGGRQALELARGCRQRGAGQVTVLWRRDRQELGLESEEIEQARSQGIELCLGVRVTGLAGSGDRLTRLTYRDRHPDPEEEDREYSLQVDAVVSAGGRLPDLVFVPVEPGQDQPEPEERPWRTVLPYAPPGEEPRGLFDTERPVSDFRAAVEAIGAGRRAAASIHQYLNGQEVAAPEKMISAHTRVLDVDGLVNLLPVGPRQPMPTADPEALLDPEQEIELGFDEKATREEARRCLNCGLLCYYRSSYH